MAEPIIGKVKDHHQTEVVNSQSSQKAKFGRNVTLFYIIQFLSGLHFISGVLLPFFIEWGGISFSQVMFLQAIFLGAAFLLEVPTGTIADFFGRKHSMMLGFIVTFIGALIYSSVPKFWIFVIAESLWALGVALLSGAQDAFLYDTLKEINREQDSKKVFGRTRSISLVGILIAAPIGSLIASTLGLRYTMMLMTVPLGSAALLCLFLKEPDIHRIEQKQKYFQIIKNGFIHIHTSRTIKILAVDLLVTSILAYFVIWTNQQRLINIGIDGSYLGYINMIWLAVEILVSNSFVTLEKVLKSKKSVVFFTTFFTGIGFILMSITQNVSIVVFGIMLAAGFGLGRWVLMIHYLNKHIPSEQRAMIISTIVMFKQLAHVMINPLVGFLVEWNLVIVLLILGGLLIVWSIISPVKESHLVD
ncbi:MAG: MFS transporter [Candidatus Lokiarchaeota archaeon]|nr:MFS transporter [Candidatus Lokiarchaeota archaeon]